MNEPIQKLTRFELVTEVVFVAVCGVLFIYALAEWVGLLPSDGGTHPFGYVCLTGGLLLQPMAVLVRPRSRVASWVLILGSVGLLAVALGVIAS